MKWGLRHRLMMLYALMALVPTLLGTGVLLLYLHSQVRKATSQFQRKTAATLQRSQHAVEAFTQQQLQRTFAQMEHDMRKGLESHQRARAIQQEKMVRQMLAQLRQRMTHSNRQLQQTTHQTMQRTLNETAQRIGMLQAQAMERLTQTTTAVSRDAIRAQVGQSSLSLTLSLSRQVDAVLQNTLTQLTLIAQQPALREMRLQESRWILQSLQDREPAYRVLCLRDITGEKLVSVGSPLTPSLSPLPKGGEGTGSGGIHHAHLVCSPGRVLGRHAGLSGQTRRSAPTSCGDSAGRVAAVRLHQRWDYERQLGELAGHADALRAAPPD
jgi:hypothetical protein